MKERPILMSPESVRSILAGMKYQTRRVLSHQPTFAHLVPHTECWRLGADGIHYREVNAHGRWEGAECYRCPYGQHDDALWVKEPWTINALEQVLYKADFEGQETAGMGWRNARYMPRIHSRLDLRITQVRVEKLQDISEGDSVAEGVTREANGPRVYPGTGAARALESYREAYARLWDSINAKRGFGWSVNPWVWVISFEVLR